MKKVFWLLLISVFLLDVGIIFADSLYDYAKAPFYGVSRKRIQVGDIVTIYVSESTSAVQQASTRTERESKLGGNVENSWEQIGNILGNETLKQNQEYKEKLANLTSENQYVGNQIKKLQPNTVDLDFLDEQVRKKLGFIDKNEIVIILNK